MKKTRVPPELRKLALRANVALAKSGLVTFTFGNVSALDRKAGIFVIKPSGVPYEKLTPAHMVGVSLETGEALETRLRPSSDTPTHLELYRAFPSCGGIAHTHSEFATSFAESRVPIRCMGTTHADVFHGDVPVTRPLSRAEVERDYERNTGLVIVETFREKGISALEIPGVLVANHGPFAWGEDALLAVENAALLEYLARIEFKVRLLDREAPRPDACLVDKHYSRKHGKRAYYGQR